MSACVSFRLGQEGFALPLEQVREIATAGRVARVPLAPPAIRGLANLRGRVVTLIDVSFIFDRPLPPARRADARIALILSAPYEHLGLYLHAPVEIARARMQRAARQAAARTEADDEGAAPSGGLAASSGRILHVLSAAELVAYCESSVLEVFRRRN